MALFATDWVGRWGGEEFGVALLDTDAAHAWLIAERIRETLVATPLTQKDGALLLLPTVSQGIATVPARASNEETLVDLVDAALYRAKARGRDQICVDGE